MPYKVLVVAPTSFFSDYGCHVRILEEVTHLEALGHRMIICTYHNGDDLPGLEIRRSWGVPWIQRPVVGSNRHRLYLDGMLTLRTFGVALRERPDVIHVHLHEGALMGVMVGRLLRIPVLFDFQGSATAEAVDHGFLKQGGLPYRFLRWLEPYLNRWPQALVTSTWNAARVLREEFDFPEGRLFTVPDGVNVHRFRPLDDVPGWVEERARLRSSLGIPPDARVVAYLGLLAPHQGTDLLLEAAQQVLQQMSDVYFLVMGFPGVDRYAAQARSLGIIDRALFPGRIPYMEAHRWLALGDVAVAPKMSATEGSGKICNYMAMALPVVAFDTPVSREMLGDLGIYASYGSVDSLAQCIAGALDDVGSSRELGRRLRERAVGGFSWARAIHDIVELYRFVGARESLRSSPAAEKVAQEAISNPGPDQGVAERSVSPDE